MRKVNNFTVLMEAISRASKHSFKSVKCFLKNVSSFSRIFLGFYLCTKFRVCLSKNYINTIHIVLW